MRHIHKPDVANNLESFRKRNDRRDFLVLNKHLISGDARYQEIAAFFRSAQEVEMTDVKQVVSARRIADTDHRSDLQCIPLTVIYRERCSSPRSGFCFPIRFRYGNKNRSLIASQA